MKNSIQSVTRGKREDIRRWRKGSGIGYPDVMQVRCLVEGGRLWLEPETLLPYHLFSFLEVEG